MGIDLSKLGLRVLKSEPAKAAVAAVILSKNDPALVAKAVESLKEAGIELPTTASYEDGTASISTDDKFMEEGTFIRVNKDFGVVLKNFNEHNVIMKSSTIGKDAELTGAFNGVNAALDFLSQEVRTVLKSDGDRAAQLKEVLADFYTYVDSLAAVPASVYKAEDAVTALVAGFQEEVVEKGSKPKEDDPEEAAEASGAAPDKEGDETGKQKAKKDDEPAEAAPADEKKDEVKPEGEEKPAETAQKEEKPAENQELSAVLQAVQSLTATVGGLAETVQKLSGDVEQVKKSTEEKLADVVRKAETAERVLKGTVIGSSIPGDPENEGTVVKKQDDDPRTGVFDTAYLRFSR